MTSQTGLDKQYILFIIGNMSLVDPTLDLAIKAALSGNWQQAIEANLILLKNNPGDVPTLNRLAKAYLESASIKDAKKALSQVLAIDPYNAIAQKMLDKAKLLPKNNLSSKNTTSTGGLSPTIFLEEPGRTKVIACLKVATPQQLMLKKPGEVVSLHVKNRTIDVVDANDTYLGILPDELAHHLGQLIKGGNAYDCYIKSVSPKSLIILIKEKSRSAKFAGTPSFPATTGYITSNKDTGNGDVVTAGEDDEEEIEDTDTAEVE